MVDSRNNPDKETMERSRQLRQRATFPERILWGRLRDRRLAGLKFRRQNPIGEFIVDFYCEEHRIVIELDGNSHNGHAEYDRARQTWIEQQKLNVIRFSNDDVLKDLESVLRAILIACKVPLDKTSSHRPSPRPSPGG